MFVIDDDIEKYASDHTQSEPELLMKLASETKERMDKHRMLTGRLEGRFLKMLVQVSGAKNILEIGMFTGYSALSMAEGLPYDGKIITCEIDPQVQEMAQKYFDKSPVGDKIEIRMGPALDTIQTLNREFDLAFIDADKENYTKYYEAVLPKLKSGGLIAIDNTLWSGRVLKPEDEETKMIDSLNKQISQDDRVENVLLTVRDGINLVRKK